MASRSTSRPTSGRRLRSAARATAPPTGPTSPTGPPPARDPDEDATDDSTRLRPVFSGMLSGDVHMTSEQSANLDNTMLRLLHANGANPRPGATNPSSSAPPAEPSARPIVSAPPAEPVRGRSVSRRKQARPSRTSSPAASNPHKAVPDIFVTMLAMSMFGYGWKADYEDSFCQHVLELSSQRICAIKWTGDSSSDPAFHGTRVLAFRRLGFGFRSGPSQQQSSTIAVVRALSRRLVAAGLNTANPPAMNHVYPEPRAASQGMHFVNALLAFLDDLGGFCSSRAAAWYSFATYLVLCHRLRLKVSFKPGKTVSPVQILHYLGFDCDMIQGIVALDVERIAELLVKLQRALTADSLSVQETLSLIGVLVFCSVVIRVGRVHYRALIDAVTALGPNPSPKARVKLDDAMRDGVSMWITMLGLLNQRPVSTPISRIHVPGQVTTDASFAGWGWEGMGSHALGQWPEDWTHRIGRASSTSTDVLRIWICELELWSCLFLARHLCPRCPHCKLSLRSRWPGSSRSYLYRYRYIL